MSEAPGRFVRLDASVPPAAVWSQIERALAQRPWW
jgi:hypothetical protein